MTRTKQNGKKGKETKKAETRVAETKVENKPKTQDEIVQQLVVKIQQNLTVTDSKFVQVNENFKKVGPGLSLSGLSRLYKQTDKSNFVLVPEFKIAGPTSVVEKLLVSLGTTYTQQKAKEYGVLDVSNYETYIENNAAVVEPVLATEQITSDKISAIAQLIKSKKTKANKDDGDVPKKKRAQRRKSHTGVELEKSPRVSVDPLTNLTLESLLELLRRLAEKQEGLDISKSEVSRESGQLILKGSKTFKIKGGSKSKRVLLDGSLRGLASETADKVSALLGELGQSEAEQKVHLDKFKPAPEARPKKVVKEAAKDAAPAKTKKEAAGKKEATKPAETTKAKTRDVKPRTSKD
jgi:hypothetical protein